MLLCYVVWKVVWRPPTVDLATVDLRADEYDEEPAPGGDEGPKRHGWAQRLYEALA